MREKGAPGIFMMMQVHISLDELIPKMSQMKSVLFTLCISLLKCQRKRHFPTGLCAPSLGHAGNRMGWGHGRSVAKGYADKIWQMEKGAFAKVI